MPLLLILSIVLPLAESVLDVSSMKDSRKIFRQFESEFGRTYKGREEKERYRVFKRRLNEVQKHNEMNHPDYYMEINKFSDMKQNELSHYLGMGNASEMLRDLKNMARSYGDDSDVILTKRTTIPLEVDHRTSGIVTPVKQQGSCGACWTFSAVGAFEGAYTQTTGYMKSFSEQELLDCYYGDAYDSCNGGYHYKPYYYIKYFKRLASYNDYPYVAQDRPCNTTLPPNGMKNVNFEGFELVPSDDHSVEKALSERLLAVAVHGTAMFPYRSGVFTGCPAVWEDPDIDHAMVMTGYTQTYWTLKNSWGEDWGENGYIRVSRDSSQYSCKITSAPVYPVMKYVDNGEQDDHNLYAEKDDDDVALTGVATQSSTFDDIGKAQRAIDGITDGNYSAGSCSQTGDLYISWWRVEFQETRTIRKIVISLRSDNATLTSQIDGATVHVGDRGDYSDEQCGDTRGIDTTTHVNYQITLECDKLQGKFVTVDLFHPRHPYLPLVLCEVQIYAHDDVGDCIAGNVMCDDGLCKPPSFC